MGSHPINLALRFVLELSALAAMGFWGWHLTAGGFRFVLAAGVPIIAAVLWGVLAVPDDPSRSGSALFAIPGVVRLIFEISFFGFALWALYTTGLTKFAAIMGALLIVHYAISYDRIAWLLMR